jgi:RNA polymerase sigma-70 factor (ECF subfamily)
MTLAEAFIPYLDEASRNRLPATAVVESALEELLSEARRSWPTLALPAEVFLSFVAQRVNGEGDPLPALREMKGSDLYLVCACLEEDPRAVEIFESQYLPEVQAAVSRMETAGAQADDIKQILCQKLLVGDGEGVPKLARYAGRGELRGWLRVTAVRAALDQLRGQKKGQRALDENALMNLASPGEDQELQYLKNLYRREFKLAFQRALAALSSRERNMLRLQLLDGLNIDQVGAMYRVHRATVARWNSKIREKLLSATRRELLFRLQIGRHEFDSIMRLIQSQFDVSICRHLGD